MKSFKKEKLNNKSLSIIYFSRSGGKALKETSCYAILKFRKKVQELPMQGDFR